MSELEENVSAEAQEELLDLNEVMDAFGVHEWQNLGPLDDASSAHQLSLLVDIQGQRYMLRERAEGMLGEDVAHRYDFQRYLKGKGIPLPDLKLTAQGEPVVMHGEDAFELQRLPDGDHFSTDDERSMLWVEGAGAMLGRIHQASRTYRGHQHRWPSEAHIGAMVQGYLNLARSKGEESPLYALTSALLNWIEQCEGVLPAAMMSIGASRSLPEFHIHGDYHALNLRFSDRNVSAVLGLEASRWEKRLFEVAYGLFSFSTLAWLPDERGTRPLVKRGLEPERAAHFLQGYSEYCPPVQGEAALLTDALQLVSPIAIINGPLEHLFYAQEDLDEATIESMMETLNWATALPAWLKRVRNSLAEMWH